MAFFFCQHLWASAGRRARAILGEGATTLEWTLSSPPPFHQFETLAEVD
jgi:cytochrome c oxidase subunit 1